ncbi:X-ray repair cross-complementing protein 5 isoform X2 [Cephus cinctus]|uniref:X-ray repair cross-complementing protein 5 isoform X2 n=1 Tax=Cephus cinctus TaxID=211228 RepID=A0AAJ7FGB4_CEPCN|nr:X-ray repair cross-complementing protein 5 isoform X2 [Cephus cinctus]
MKLQTRYVSVIGERDISQNSLSAMNSSEKFVMKLCEKTDNQYFTLDDAVQQTSFYRQRPTKPIGWGTTLDFAGFKIPIAKYLKVTNSWKLPTWKKLVKSDYNKEVKVNRVHQYTDRYRESHTFENIISGYMYGGVFVPYTDTTKTEAEYKSGEKSFIIRNFAKRNEVYLDLWTGNGSYVVVPSGQEAIRPFYSLVQAMVDEDMVAIVRKVHYSNLAPRMGILFPYINVLDQPGCLVFVEMIFTEDRCLLHRMPMNSLVKQLSKEQDEAIDGFIDSMTLPESRCASDSDEIEKTFDAGTVHNPGIQHVWNVLSRRALNPDSEIPPMESYLSKLVMTPAPLKEKSLPYLKKIEKLFQWKDTYETKNKLNDKKETDVKETKEKLQDDSKAGSKNIAEDAPEVQETMDAELSQQFIDDVDLDNLAMNM